MSTLYKTIGVGGDYTNITNAFYAIWDGGILPSGDSIDFDIISTFTDAVGPSYVFTGLAAGCTCRVHCSHNENEPDITNWYSVIRQGNEVRNYTMALGTYLFENVKWSWGTTIGWSEIPLLISFYRWWASPQIIFNKCVFKGENEAYAYGLGPNNNHYIIKSCLFYGLIYGLYHQQSIGYTHLVENCSFVKNNSGVISTATGVDLTLRNTVSIWGDGVRATGSDFNIASLGAATLENCRSEDTSLAGVGTDCAGSINPAAEFVSTAYDMNCMKLNQITHSNLKIYADQNIVAPGVPIAFTKTITETVGSALNYSGKTPSSADEDLAGTAMPNASSDYPIGCYSGLTVNPVSYAWNFGDSTTSTSEAPSKTYTKKGDYTITLVGTDLLGTILTTTTIYYIVSGVTLSQATFLILGVGVYNIYRVTYDGVPLKKITLRDMDAMDLPGYGGSITTGQPTHYYVFGTKIGLWPIPDTAGKSIKVWFNREPVQITTASTSMSIPSHFHRYIPDYALYRMYAKDNNESKALFHKKLWDENADKASADWTLRNGSNAFRVVRDEANYPTTDLGII